MRAMPCVAHACSGPPTHNPPGTGHSRRKLSSASPHRCQPPSICQPLFCYSARTFIPLPPRARQAKHLNTPTLPAAATPMTQVPGHCCCLLPSPVHVKQTVQSHHCSLDKMATEAHSQTASGSSPPRHLNYVEHVTTISNSLTHE